ncbi:MAG: hypothetical protein RQ732_01030 [Methylophaga sp.]|nr:hypothetical protein [Methylophaga sp.]
MQQLIWLLSLMSLLLVTGCVLRTSGVNNIGADTFSVSTVMASMILKPKACLESG